MRLALLTANARTALPCTLEITDGTLANAASMWPPITSPIAADAPL